MLSITNLTISYDQAKILINANWRVGDKEKVGLVGPNGSGKSTLLKTIAGLFSIDGGKIERSSRMTIGYLPQEFTAEEKIMTPLEFITQSGGVNYKVEIGQLKVLANKLELTEDIFDRPIGNLSGGEQSKVALLRIILSHYDLYLLDEPTNNLDFAGLVFLEYFIKRSQASFIIVSHDRKFLDRTVAKIVELNEVAKTLKVYGGNYSEYRLEKAAELERQWSAYQDYQDEQNRLQKITAKQKQWAIKGQNKPNVTDNDKYRRGYIKDRSAKLSHSAKNIEGRLKKIPAVKRLSEDRLLKFALEPIERSGVLAFELKGLTKKLKHGQVGPIDLIANYGDRLAILGRNGVGKTTLLEMIVGHLNSDQGLVKLGSRLQFGYLEQLPLKNLSQTVLETALAQNVDQTETRRLLDRFGLSRGDFDKPVSILSPGERSRLILAILALKRPNLLILDEPSNHLDNEAMESLEQALADYQGTLLIVSHDRYFLDKVKPTHFYLLESSGEIKRLVGYEAYEQELLDKK